MANIEQQRERLINLLKALFQLDQPDLDFGFYRIMHARSAQVSDFLENDLLSIIREAFGEADDARIAETRERLKWVRQKAADDGVPEAAIEDYRPVREARQAFEAARETGDSEGDVYDHLYRFFERYYDQGDFMSRRYFARETDGKAAPYAIPYDGREVYLHWANRDQYYIKTSEYLTNFTFDPTQAPEYRAVHGALFEQRALKTHCRIIAASEGEHNNIKASGRTERYFIIHAEQPVKLETGQSGAAELVIQFEYRADPEKQGQEGTWRKKRLEEAAECVKAALGALDQAEDYAAALMTPAPTEKEKDRTLLEKYIGKYAARNTMDYFIHKDLGGFLRRELDFYIKNEVMRLDDIESADAPRVESYLSRIKVLRRIGRHLIDFLAQLEDFQKKLWLKKKFVVDTQYCITLDRIPEQYYPEIAANEAQREEWVKLFAIDEMSDYSEPLTIDFLKANPFLVLDTVFFSEELKDLILSTIQFLDENMSGLMIHSENFQALNIMQEKYKNQIQCIYIDPPFKTGNDFLYKDAFLNSTWLILIDNRLNADRRLLSQSGSHFLHLDHNANYFGRMLMDKNYGYEKFKNEIIWHYQSGGRQENAFSRKHDTIFFYERSKEEGAFYKDAIGIKRGTGKKNNMKRGIDPDGRIYFSIKSAGKIYKYYEDEKITPDDVWNDINHLQQKDPQRTGFITQKPEHLLQRLLCATTVKGDWVLDYFMGSGTTLSTSMKLKRRWLGVEMGEHFYSKALVRLKRNIFGIKTGIGREISYDQSHVFKYIRLESYEDTQNNLILQEAPVPKGAAGFQRDYLLHYWLDFETRGSPSLLNIQDFADPAAYKLKVKTPGTDEYIEKAVDLVETFNWLIGLHVEHLDRWHCYDATFKREQDPELPEETDTRLILDGPFKETDSGAWRFRKIEGYTLRAPGDHADRERTLVIWRKLTGDMEKDNLMLDEWFKQCLTGRDAGFDVIYVNGSNNLLNLRRAGETWQVRLTEEHFHRAMWEAED